MATAENYVERGCGECWRGTRSLGGPWEKLVGEGMDRRGRQDAQEGRYVGVITPPSGIRDRGSPRPSLPLFSSPFVANSASAPSFPAPPHRPPSRLSSSWSHNSQKPALRRW